MTLILFTFSIVGSAEVCGGSPSPAKAELNEGTSALTVLQPVHSPLSPNATYTPLPSFSQYPTGKYFLKVSFKFIENIIQTRCKFESCFHCSNLMKTEFKLIEKYPSYLMGIF